MAAISAGAGLEHVGSLEHDFRRADGGVAAHSGKAAWAADARAGRVGDPPPATVAKTSPVYGFRSSNVPPSAASTHSPPMYS